MTKFTYERTKDQSHNPTNDHIEGESRGEPVRVSFSYDQWQRCLDEASQEAQSGGNHRHEHEGVVQDERGPEEGGQEGSHQEDVPVPHLHETRQDREENSAREVGGKVDGHDVSELGGREAGVYEQEGEEGQEG